MKIQISLNSASVDKAIQQLEDYKKKINKDLLEVAKRLAEIGQAYADNGFIGAIYDGDRDVRVGYEKTERGYKIVAKGRAVCFIEFGAGVYYNGLGGSYPEPLPSGIAGIGEYGHGRGKQFIWVFKDNGKPFYTHGNPPNAVMYKTKKQLIRELPRIAKEVFSK